MSASNEKRKAFMNVFGKLLLPAGFVVHGNEFYKCNIGEKFVIHIYADLTKSGTLNKIYIEFASNFMPIELKQNELIIRNRIDAVNFLMRQDEGLFYSLCGRGNTIDDFIESLIIFARPFEQKLLSLFINVTTLEKYLDAECSMMNISCEQLTSIKNGSLISNAMGYVFCNLLGKAQDSVRKAIEFYNGMIRLGNEESRYERILNYAYGELDEALRMERQLELGDLREIKVIMEERNSISTNALECFFGR